MATRTKYGSSGAFQEDADHVFNDTHERYVERKLAGFATSSERRVAKLILDIGHVLTGPTSAANADRLAASLVSAEGPEVTVQALERVMKRYRMGGR